MKHVEELGSRYAATQTTDSLTVSSDSSVVNMHTVARYAVGIDSAEYSTAHVRTVRHRDQCSLPNLSTPQLLVSKEDNWAYIVSLGVSPVNIQTERARGAYHGNLSIWVFNPGRNTGDIVVAPYFLVIRAYK